MATLEGDQRKLLQMIALAKARGDKSSAMKYAARLRALQSNQASEKDIRVNRRKERR